MLYFSLRCRQGTQRRMACATASLVATERGFIRFKDLYERAKHSRGQRWYCGATPITEFHKEERVTDAAVTTRRGFTIEGALKHRRPDGMARGSSSVVCGQASGSCSPADRMYGQRLTLLSTNTSQSTVSIGAVAAAAGTSYGSVIDICGTFQELRSRHRECSGDDWLHAGRRSADSCHTAPALPPAVVNEPLAHSSATSSAMATLQVSICLTCGDEEYARRLTTWLQRARYSDSLRDDRTATDTLGGLRSTHESSFDYWRHSV